MFRALCALTTGLLLSYPTSALALVNFNPGEYVLNAVTCPTVDRVLNQTVSITIGEYTAAYMRLAGRSLMT